MRAHCSTMRPPGPYYASHCWGYSFIPAFCSCAGQAASAMINMSGPTPLTEGNILWGLRVRAPCFPAEDPSQIAPQLSVHSGSWLDNSSFVAAFLPHFPSSYPFPVLPEFTSHTNILPLNSCFSSCTYLRHEDRERASEADHN